MVIQYNRLDYKKKREKIPKREKKFFRHCARIQIDNIRCLIRHGILVQPESTQAELDFLTMIKKR